MNKSRTEPGYPYVCTTKQTMKSRVLLSPLWKIGSWKKLFLCGKKSLEKPTVEFPHEIIESEILPRLPATLELPPEIIEWEILPRLPATSLRRFMCVCKQWKSLISTYEFTRKNLHHVKNQQSQTHHKLLEIDYLSKTFSTRDCSDINNHDSTTIRSIPFVNEAQKVLLIASLDGLIFVKLRNTSELAFWNPLTGAYKKLSNSSNFYSLFDAFGFYFDAYKKDYKVLQVTNCLGAFKAFIYSQRLNSWKEIQWLENHQRFSNLFWSTPISLGESLYFIGKRYNVTNYRHQYWIIAFDVKSEKFREIRFPLLNQENTYYHGILMVIKCCIHICAARYIHIQETGLMTMADGELWRMDGDGDGWTKVKDIPPARNHSLTLGEKIDTEDLARNIKANRGDNGILPSTRKILYLETLVIRVCG